MKRLAGSLVLITATLAACTSSGTETSVPAAACRRAFLAAREWADPYDGRPLRRGQGVPTWTDYPLDYVETLTACRTINVWRRTSTALNVGPARIYRTDAEVAEWVDKTWCGYTRTRIAHTEGTPVCDDAARIKPARSRPGQ